MIVIGIFALLALDAWLLRDILRARRALVVPTAAPAPARVPRAERVI